MHSTLLLLKRAAWAPLLVLIVHQLIQHTPWRKPLDFAMHFSGGLAMGYLMLHALRVYEAWLGKPSALGRVIFSFALALTIGVFWEFAELASDVFFKTHIQISIWETMRDLIADSCGAAVALMLCAVFARQLFHSEPAAK